MAKQDIQTIIGSSISKDETLLKNFKSIKSCFVGWVESYNETSGTVNVQPAIQDYIPNDEQNGSNYRNSPLLVNVWVFGAFKSTAIEKGDKAVCFVLDQKANDFFKCIYDSSLSLGFQTFKPKTSAQKSVCDCVCVILGDASFQEVYEAISAIDTALENKADIDGTYPDMTVGNAIQAQKDGEGNVIPDTYVKFSNFTDSFEGNGYSILPNGLIMQWGTVGAYSTNGNKIQVFNVDLPISFTSQIFNIQAVLRTGDFVDGGTQNYYNYFLATNPTNLSQIKISVRWLTQYTSTIYWFAIGY